VESIDKQRVATSNSSIGLMQKEMEDQILELPAFASALRRRDEGGNIDPSEMVFTGSGDSYAASLFAHHLSKGRALAEDPNDLTLAPEACQGKIVFIISVSGRTRANILLARRVKRIARRRVAISANPVSLLARECDETIPLPYRRNEPITPGTLSFTLSLLAIASRIKPLPTLPKLQKMSARARKWAQEARIHLISNFLFLGSGVGYALAAYGAFKIQEVIGERAEYDHAEQLGHSKLFSVRKPDNILCIALGPDKKTSNVSRTLVNNDFNAHLLASDAEDLVVAGLEAAFSIQQLALRLAKRKRLREVAFLTDRKRLALSSRLIY
jgi:fructoselysine-6-P-deglycase FrlB-like protein